MGDKEIPKQQKICFVIMPIGKEGTESARRFKDIYDIIIKEAIEEAGLGYKCIRADEVQKPNTIIKDIGRNIRDADVVIADLTDRNPNVFYELGVRHALQGTSIILAQDLSQVPFDLQNQRLILYNPSEPRNVSDAKKRIQEFLRSIDTEPKSSDSPISEIVGECTHPEEIAKAPVSSDPLITHFSSLKQTVENAIYTLSEHMHQFGDHIRQTVCTTVKDALQLPELIPHPVERVTILNTLNACGISNIYERRTEAYDRIVSLIKEARERVDLMGISLRRFFHNDTEINQKIKHMKGHQVKWRVLVIDPETDQAIYRSLREQETTYKNLLKIENLEYAMMNKEELFEAYQKTYENMMLYTDIHKTMRDIHYTLEQAGIEVTTRLYKAAPACFLAFIDDILFVEQYHYGATPDERVAEQVPLFEFRRGSDMYKQMLGHFDYVWKHLSKAPDDSTRDQG